MAQLDVMVEAIIDATVASVEEAALEGVKEVVRGDRARPMPNLPCIWVVAQRANMVRGTYGVEDWVLPLSIAALVKGDQPEEASKLSQKLAAQARSAVLQMEIEDTDVTDVVSSSFEPTDRSKDRALFWTEAVVTVTFTVTE
jgi:hypothetical protein